MARLAGALTTSPLARRIVVGSSGSLPVTELLSASADYEVSVVGTPVTDTCKEVVGGVVRRTIPREALVDAGGPWVFTRQALSAALARIRGRENEIGDMVALAKASQLRVRVLPRQ